MFKFAKNITKNEQADASDVIREYSRQEGHLNILMHPPKTNKMRSEKKRR